KLAAVAQRSDDAAKNHVAYRKSHRFFAHRHSQGRRAGAPTALRRHKVFGHQPARVAGDEADTRCHDRSAEGGWEKLGPCSSLVLVIGRTRTTNTITDVAPRRKGPS